MLWHEIITSVLHNFYCIDAQYNISITINEQWIGLSDDIYWLIILYLCYKFRTHVYDPEYDCPTPCFDQREEIENHSAPVENITKQIKAKKRNKKKNGPTIITFNDSIQETALSKKIISSKNNEKIEVSYLI